MEIQVLKRGEIGDRSERRAGVEFVATDPLAERGGALDLAASRPRSPRDRASTPSPLVAVGRLILVLSRRAFLGAEGGFELGGVALEARPPSVLGGVDAGQSVEAALPARGVAGGRAGS